MLPTYTHYLFCKTRHLSRYPNRRRAYHTEPTTINDNVVNPATTEIPIAKHVISSHDSYL